MDSIANLNAWSNTTVTYNDFTLPEIVFTPNVAVNQTASVTEGGSFAANLGTDITTLNNYSTGNVYYQINLSAAPGSSVTWPEAISNVRIANSAGIYTVYNITNSQEWNIYRTANIVLGRDQGTDFIYYSTISDSQGNVRTWQTLVSVSNLLEMSQPGNVAYQGNTVNYITSGPLITNTENTSNVEVYSLTVQPVQFLTNVVSTFGNIRPAGNVSAFTTNANSGGFSLAGTRPLVNGLLANLVYNSASTQETDWLVRFQLTNPVSNLVSNTYQILYANTAQIMSHANISYYNEDQTFSINNAPEITDVTGNLSLNYSMNVYPVISNTVSNISTTGTLGSVNFNSNTKIYTITGNAAAVNSRLANLTITPALDYDSDIYLNLDLTTYDSRRASRIHRVLIAQAGDLMPNINISRSYVSNQANDIFETSTPQITEITAPGTVYTLVISSSLGYFVDDTTQYIGNYALLSPVLTLTGSREYINGRMDNILFYPYRNISSNGFMQITQYRDSLLQYQISVPLNGSARTTPIPWQGTESYTSISSVPSSNTPRNIWEATTSETNLTRYLYLKANVTLVGAGGAGGNTGGGGGGRIQSVSNISLQSNISAFVGAGGRGWPYAESGQSTYLIGSNLVATGGNVGTDAVGGSSGAYTSTGTGGAGAGGDWTGNTGGPGQAVSIRGNVYYMGAGGGGASNTGPVLTGGNIGLSSATIFAGNGRVTSPATAATNGTTGVHNYGDGAHVIFSGGAGGGGGLLFTGNTVSSASGSGGTGVAIIDFWQE